MPETLDYVTECARCGEGVGGDIDGGLCYRGKDGAVICEDCFFEESGKEPRDVAFDFWL